jgi:hypothetical protein
MTELISLLQRIRLARAMPEANPLTLEITANILASHGLLDEQPPSKPPVGAPGDLSGWRGRRQAGADDDARFS